MDKVKKNSNSQLCPVLIHSDTPLHQNTADVGIVTDVSEL
jgi:hypothetical protein